MIFLFIFKVNMTQTFFILMNLKYFQTYLIFNIILTHAFPVREMRRSGILLIFLVSNFSAVNENFDKITR